MLMLVGEWVESMVVHSDILLAVQMIVMMVVKMAEMMVEWLGHL